MTADHNNFKSRMKLHIQNKSFVCKGHPSYNFDFSFDKEQRLQLKDFNRSYIRNLLLLNSKSIKM